MRLGVIACLAVGSVFLGLTPSAQAQSAPAVQVERPLHATSGPGARIVDDLDRTVILRGVNVSGLGEYYEEWDDLPAPIPVEDADFEQMAEFGFNSVRLLITWSSLEPERGVIDTAYIDEIAEAVEWAEANDIYVMLDMHQDAWSAFVDTPDGVTCPEPLLPAVGWDGAPEWATPITDGILTCYAASREISVAVQTAFENFYLDLGGVQSHLIEVWATLAERFAADPVIAGYDLLNEPNPGLTIGVDDFVLLGVFYDRALDAIRGAESNAPGGFDHIGFFEPAVLTGQLPIPGPLPGFTADDNIVYAPHIYSGSIGLLPQTTEENFAAAATAAESYGTTFLSGEWGWFGDDESDAPKIARYAALEDEYLIGGMWWQWEQACGDPHAIRTRGTRPSCADTGQPSDGLLSRDRSNTMILDRAYPRASPGRLASIDADIDTGALTIEGTAARSDTSADLWVPERCEVPVVTGEGTGGSDAVAVPGGWRIAVEVPDPGDYTIEVTCRAPSEATPPTVSTAPAPSAKAPAPHGSTLPATGNGQAVALSVALALAALEARRRVAQRR